MWTPSRWWSRVSPDRPTPPGITSPTTTRPTKTVSAFRKSSGPIHEFAPKFVYQSDMDLYFFCSFFSTCSRYVFLPPFSLLFFFIILWPLFRVPVLWGFFGRVHLAHIRESGSAAHTHIRTLDRT